ncbi:RNase adapter RapZ [bacterium]|nr:RNase adapter RapZ [bacterium]
MNLVVISGSSGSGKTEALKYFEDSGYFCIDNIPISLIPPFLMLIKKNGIQKAAMGADARVQELFKKEISLLSDLKVEYPEIKLIYLDASDEILYKRYNETRRKHPFPAKNLFESIQGEKHILREIVELSDIYLDTSKINVHQLKDKLAEIIEKKDDKNQFMVHLASFGFKYGDFSGAHLLFDVRFLPNPFFIDELKHKTGLSEDVYSYVINNNETECFLRELDRMLDYLIPQYIKERRHYLHIAIGCTGGKHRSVSVVRYIEKKLIEKNINYDISHREIDS